MQNYHDNQRLKEEVREAYLSDDFFSVKTPELIPSLNSSRQPDSTFLPHWMAVTRFICLLIGGLGFVFTFINIDYLSHLISHPFFLNLSLLTGLGGFASYMIYPYLVSNFVANGGIRLRLLRYLNGIMLGFSIVLLITLLTIPVTGLGLCLILLPAPISFAMSSRKYLRHDRAEQDAKISLTELFNQDLRRLAWMSLFAAFLAFFAIIFLGF